MAINRKSGQKSRRAHPVTERRDGASEFRGRLAIGLALVASVVLFVVAVVDRGKRRPAGPAPTMVKAETVAPPVVAAVSISRRPASETARDLLAGAPAAVRIDDLRIHWPGPDYAVRGHATSQDQESDLLKWQEEVRKRSEGEAYQSWFRRLDHSADGVSFELVVAPERDTLGVSGTGKRTAAVSDPTGTGEDPPSSQEAWSQVLIDASLTGGTRLSELNRKPEAFASAVYNGEESLLLETLAALERRNAPLGRVWLGPQPEGSTDSGARLLVELTIPH